MGRGGELIAVVGLAFEARIAAGPGVRVISRRNDEDLAVSLARAFRDGARGVVSFGVAGGLSPNLAPGTCVIGSVIVSGTDRMKRLSMHDDWSKSLLQAMPGAIRGPLYGSPGPVTNPRAKAALYRRTGAIAVDMESPYRRRRGGRAWAAHGRPPGHHRSGGARTTSVRPGRPTAERGRDIAALIWSVLKRPCDLPSLMRLALDAHAARRTLLRGRELLESSCGTADFIAPVPEAGMQIVRRPVAARAELSFSCDHAPSST
jgi:adenosylhomocysteine nucleosidase